MKNNLHNTTSKEFILNNNISTSSKKEINQNSVIKNNSNKKEKLTDTIDNRNLKNEIYEGNEKKEINNNFLINIQLFKVDYYSELKNKLNNLNDLISVSSDLSFKEENIFKKNFFSFQKMPEMAEKEKKLYLNNKNDITNLKFNNSEEIFFDSCDNDDCSSKMTNLYVQEFDKKIINEPLD